MLVIFYTLFTLWWFDLIVVGKKILRSDIVRISKYQVNLVMLIYEMIISK